MRNPYSFLHLTSLTCAVVAGSIVLSTEAQAHPGHTDSNSNNSNAPNPQNLSYDDLDNDAFAIPLDNSRTELDEEEADLENLEQQNLQKQRKNSQ